MVLHNLPTHMLPRPWCFTLIYPHTYFQGHGASQSTHTHASKALVLHINLPTHMLPRPWCFTLIYPHTCFQGLGASQSTHTHASKALVLHINLPTHMLPRPWCSSRCFTIYPHTCFQGLGAVLNAVQSTHTHASKAMVQCMSELYAAHQFCLALPRNVFVFHIFYLFLYRLVGLVAKASTSRVADPWFDSCFVRGDFSGLSHTCDSKVVLQWLPCQAPVVTGSALRLVGPVSVYCDWVRWKVWSAAFISVWQHVRLSEQIRPWDVLACWWDVKHPNNKQTCVLVTGNSVSCFCPPCWPAEWVTDVLVHRDCWTVCTVVCRQ